MHVFGKIIVQKANGVDGMEFVLSTLSCVIGRNNECDIRISNTDVSREHCQLIVRENGEVYLANLNKMTTTLRNGVPITKAVILHHLDVFTVGSRSFRWEFPPEFLHKKSQFTVRRISTVTRKSSAKRRSSGKTLKKRDSKSPKTPRSTISRRSMKKSPLSTKKTPPSTRKTPRSVKRTPQSSKSPRTSVTPRTRRNSQLVTVEKTTGEKLSVVVTTPKQTNDIKGTSDLSRTKTKKNSRKRKAKKIVSTKVKMIKANPTPSGKFYDDLSVSKFDSLNISQDIFVSPLDNDIPSTKRINKRRSTSISINAQDSFKKGRMSVTGNESTPLNRNRTPQTQETIPQTPLSSKKSTRKPPRKKQNTPIPDYTSVEGMKRLFRESGPLPDYSNIAGLKNMLRNRTPEADYTNARGLKRLFSKTPRNDLTNITGVKQLFTKSVTSDYSNGGGLKRLQRKSKTPNLHNVSGVAQLFNTPNTPGSAKVNSLRKVLRSSLSGQELRNTPQKILNSPIVTARSSSLRRSTVVSDLAKLTNSPLANRSLSKSPIKRPRSSSLGRSMVGSASIKSANSLSPNRSPSKSPVITPRSSSLRRSTGVLAPTESANFSSPNRSTRKTRQSSSLRRSISRRRSTGDPALIKSTNSPSPNRSLSRSSRKTPQSLKRKSKSPIRSTSPKKKLSLTKFTSHDHSSPSIAIINPSPTDGNLNTSNKTPFRRQQAIRRTAKTGDNSELKAQSPRITRSAKKVSKRHQSPAKETKIVPTRRARKVKEDIEAISPPISSRKRAARTKSTADKEVTKSAKTPTKRRTKAAATPSTGRKKTAKANDDRFESKLTPFKDDSSKSTKVRRKINVVTSPVNVTLRRSKRTMKSSQNN